MAFRYSPGCCCDPTCKIARDFFDGDNLSSAWEAVSGSPTVSGGKLRTSSGANLVIHRRPANVDGIYSSVTATVGSLSDSVSLIVAYVDADNYWCLQATPGISAGVAQIMQVSGGSAIGQGLAVSVQGFTATGTISLNLCYANGKFSASASSGFGAVGISHEAEVEIDGTRAGVGAESSGSVNFDSFVYSANSAIMPSCPRCGVSNGCGVCAVQPGTDPPNAPPAFQVEIYGLINGFFPLHCDDCEAWNGVYLLDNYSWGLTFCDYYIQVGTLCGFDATLLLRLAVSPFGFGNYTMFLQGYSNTETEDGGNFAFSGGIHANGWPCLELDQFPLDFSPFHAYCWVNPGAFAKVTAVLG